MLIKFIPLMVLFSCLAVFSCQPTVQEQPPVKTGAELTGLYLNDLAGKSVGLVCNHSSVLGVRHLLDTLVSLNIDVVKIYTPEHGFRGKEDAGKRIGNSVDSATGTGIVSLYGDKHKPVAEDLAGIDIMVFDVQDVGVRFYTYVSTLHYIMEACAEHSIPLIVLDRPNPNGHYVDGPLLEVDCRSFVGLHPVPLVHGMTIGEYARMIDGEGWLPAGVKCNLKVIPCENYTHAYRYSLVLNPSPNLKSMRAIYLYPSLGLFEGTVMSVGRGTAFPFEVAGHPDYPDTQFRYTPRSIEGAENPKYRDRDCYGINLQDLPADSLSEVTVINLDRLITVYKKMNMGERFFIPYFDKLAGNKNLRQQIVNGLSPYSIRKTWEAGLGKFRLIRKKYLLYPDAG